MNPSLFSCLLLGAAPLAAAPLFEDVPPSTTGVDFTFAFKEDDPQAFLYYSGFACGGISIGDLNGDMRPDLVFTNGPGDNAVFLNDGGFKFHQATPDVLRKPASWSTSALLVDIDADGDLDIFLTAYDAPCRWYLNDGKAGFTEAPGAFGADIMDACHVPAFADADNDGDLDLFIVCNALTRPEGRPAEMPVDIIGGKPVVRPEFEKYYEIQNAAGGRFGLDAYGRADYFLLNEGTPQKPRFRDVTKESGLLQRGYGLSCVWFDMDSDGDQDLFIANDFLEPDRLFRNDGKGADGIPRFTDVAADSLPSVTWSSMGSDVGDVNNDGLPDLMVVDMAGSTHFKAKLNMGEMQGLQRTVLENGWPRQAMRNHLFINTGTPRWQETAFASGVANSDWSWAVKLADYDADGWLDVFVANGAARNFSDSDRSMEIGDLNRALIGKTEWDLYKDLKPMREKNLAWSGKDGRHFDKSAGEWGLDLEGLSFSAAHGDLDGDGDLDLVVSDLGGRPRLYRNGTPKDRSFTVTLRGLTNTAGIGAKVVVESESGKTFTRWQMPWTGFKSQNDGALHFGLGAEKAKTVTVTWPSGKAQTVSAKPGEMRTHVEESAAAPTIPIGRIGPIRPILQPVPNANGIAFRHTENPFDDFRDEPLLPARMSQLGAVLAAADADGDGDMDVFCGGANGQDSQVFICNAGKYEQLKPCPFTITLDGSEVTGALWFDADGDKLPDLYIATGGNEDSAGASSYRDVLYLNAGGKDGALRLREAGSALPSENTDSGGIVVAADIDGDSDRDLFTGSRSVPGAYPVSPESRLLRNDSTKGSPAFTDITKTAAPSLLNAGMVTGGVWADVDGDKDADLVLSVEWGPVKVLLNDEGRLAEAQGLDELNARSGWWSALAAADLDGDGRLDFLCGNAGLNTKYGHPSPAKPQFIYRGDMDGTARPQIVEAKFAEDRLLPVRGRSCSSTAMPLLKTKFPTFRAFASSDLAAIYSDKVLASAQKWTAVCLESGVLWNDSRDGKVILTWQPLPWEAQLSQINAFAVADLDGDGRGEVIAAQNNFSREPETGLWRGNPGGVFRFARREVTFIPPAASGLLLPNDTRSIIAADFTGDARPDVLAGQNNDQVLLFRSIN